MTCRRDQSINNIFVRKKTYPRLIVLLILTFFSFALPSCTPRSSGKSLTTQEIIAMNSLESVPPFRLAPGDKIAVKFYFNPGLNDEVVIRPDGKISLQLIDEIQAAGLTPDELDLSLTRAYASALHTSITGYTIGIGDRLAVKSYYYENINEEVVVRPDGKISLQLIDDVQAAGLHTDELDRRITARLRKFIENPDISIIVRDFHRPDLTVLVQESPAQRIYVGGEVRTPSVVPLRGYVGVWDALVQAGGTLETAHLENIALLRKSSTGTVEVYSINIEDIQQGKSPNILLRPYDIVYVPKTAMAEVESFVRMNIYRLIPPQLLFSFTYDLNPEIQVKADK